MRRHALTAVLLVTVAGAASAEPRELCADRPGLGTPPCTIEPGRSQVEIGIADWTRESGGGVRTDTIIAGDALARIGLSDHAEARIGWSAYGHRRERDRSAGTIEREGGIGDLSLGGKLNLRHPDGEGLSIALLPYATLPTGGRAIGAGTWGAGLIVPVSLPAGKLTVEFVPEVDAAPDEDRRGRHLAYGGTVGVGGDIADAVNAMAEVQWIRDRDPAGHSAQALAGLSLAWQPEADLQIDVGTNAGINRDSPDVELYLGVTRRF